MSSALVKNVKILRQSNGCGEMKKCSFIEKLNECFLKTVSYNHLKLCKKN